MKLIQFSKQQKENEKNNNKKKTIEIKRQCDNYKGNIALSGYLFLVDVIIVQNHAFLNSCVAQKYMGCCKNIWAVTKAVFWSCASNFQVHCESRKTILTAKQINKSTRRKFL